MKNVKRLAAIVTPKSAFFAWPALFADKNTEDCDPEEFRTLFLIPERDDVEEALDLVCSDIFDKMTQSWINAPDMWPDIQTLESFHQWFEVETVQMVIDAAPRSSLHFSVLRTVLSSIGIRFLLNRCCKATSRQGRRELESSEVVSQAGER